MVKNILVGFSRSKLVRSGIVALGAALTVPALAESDALPQAGTSPLAASAAWSGAYAPAMPAIGPVIFSEPGSFGDVRGAFGRDASRSPLAVDAPRPEVTNVYVPVFDIGAN